MRIVQVGELPEDAIWSECDFFVLYFYLFIYNYICMGQVYIMMKDVGELTSENTLIRGGVHVYGTGVYHDEGRGRAAGGCNQE
jgi:hypothetical protein